MKDGVGCWLGDDPFVLAGGLFEPLDQPSEPSSAGPKPPKPPKPPPLNKAFGYDTKTDTWATLPPAPFYQSRGTGACTADSLLLVGGRTKPPEGLSVPQRHLAHSFSAVFRPFCAALSPFFPRCPASWRQDGENGRKMAKNGRNLGEKRARNSGG